MKISKITKQLLLITILPITGVAVFLTLHIYNNLQRTEEMNIRNRQKLLNEEIRKLHAFKFRSLNSLENRFNKELERQIEAVTNELELSPLPVEDIDPLAMREQLGMKPATHEIYICNSNGIVVNTTDRQSSLQNFNNLDFVEGSEFLDLIGKNDVTLMPLTYETESGNLRKLAYNTSSGGNFMVIIKSYPPAAQAIREHLKKSLNNITINHPAVQAVNVYVNQNPPVHLYQNASLDGNMATLVNTVFKNQSKNLQLPVEDNEALIRILNYHPYNNAGFLKEYAVEVIYDRKTAGAAMTPLYNSTFIGMGIALVVIIFFVIFFLRRYVIIPAFHIRKAIKRLSEGNISEESKMAYTRRDEFGDIIQNYNYTIDELNDLANFIQELGKGNLDVEFQKSITEEDVLSMNLLSLRDNIKKLEEERKEREKADEISDWMTKGLQEFNQMIQRAGNEIDEISHQVLKNLTQYIHAQQGAIYILANLDKANSELVQTATFAYNRKITRKKHIKMREGLVGMVAAEKEKIYRTEIPEDYADISTGLGRTAPKSILFVPVKTEDQILGVIELASLHEMEDYQIAFAEQVASNVSHHIMTAKNNEKNEQLLQQFAKQSEKFQNQEQELKDRIETLEKQSKQKDEEIEELQEDISRLYERLAKARGRIDELKH